MELYHKPANAFVAVFIGSPRLKFLNVEIEPVKGNKLLIKSDAMNGVEIENLWNVSPNKSKVLLAIRPQYIEPCQEKESLISGIVDFSERLGSETIVDIRLNDTSNIKMSLAADETFVPEDKVHMTFDLAKAHLFAE